MKIREEQATELSQLFGDFDQQGAHSPSKYTDLPVFVAGDFNEEPSNNPINIMKDGGFEDLYSCETN